MRTERGVAASAARTRAARYAAAMTTASAVQTAAERRAAEAATKALIGKLAPDHARLVSGLRKAVRSLLPSAHELVYEYRSWFVLSFSPTTRGHEGVLAIRGEASGVKLYLNRGKELRDPERLLKGSGSLVRFIEVASAAALRRPAVKALIDEALDRNPLPFEANGAGSIVLRLDTPKKAKQRRKKA